MKKYICPACKKEQTSICQSQIGSQVYILDLESEQWDTKYDFEGEHEAWLCPECGNEIDHEFVEKNISYISLIFFKYIL